ncbi:ATP-binding cassette domain-containing protein [Granulicella cerasi]|uniref:ATP-binding cassette domain-containing protein n=2 Tax=Granulicella cerasi TaxID=741063 RepID=A0ABW1ZH01_9BACT|nr:ATP-binding cassette domain-containing protein [Granulicella cerasi]
MAARSVEFANVSFDTPGGQRILRDVSLTVDAGETVALLGRSGSGKTTLLRMVNALVKPTSGRVLVGGREVSGDDVVALRRGIGYVIQETGLFPHMTVERNVSLPLELAQKADASAVERALQDVGLPPAEFAKKYPWQMSGGQRQRAGVARALVAGQDVLLMDEPFGALDPLTRAEMQTMLHAVLRKDAKTTLIVTHDLDEALFLADRVALVEQGRVVADERAEDVLASQNEAMQAYVRAARRAELSA